MLPTALTLAGLDPSGGAGIAADLRSFAAAGAWGAAACACLTVQSTRGVQRVVPVSPELLLAQAREILGDACVRALKTGALGSNANVRAVALLFDEHPRILRVVDPVMIPSRSADSGARLNARRLGPMRALAARATLVTPNLAEAGALLSRPVVSENDARLAAAAFVARGATAALVKGGHGEGPESVDFLAVGRRVLRIARPRRSLPTLHGTGCTLAALVAGRLATTSDGSSRRRAVNIIEAVLWARERLDQALAAPLEVGRGLRVIDVNAFHVGVTTE